MEAERKCCPFFRFDITVEPDEGPIWLEIGGSDRVKQFVADNIVARLEEHEESGRQT